MAGAAGTGSAVIVTRSGAKPKTNMKTKPRKVTKGASKLYLHNNTGGPSVRSKRGYDRAFQPGKAYLAGMPDVVETPGAILGAKVPIQQVGVSHFRIPLRIRARGGRTHTLETSVTGTVSLEASQKGINMSRILRAFCERSAEVFSLDSLGRVLEDCRRSVGALRARIRLSFSFPLRQRSLRSGLSGWQYHEVTLEGRMEEDGVFHRFMEFDFVYSSACPCSAELSEHARDVRGAYSVPHTQRSKARVRVELAPGARLAIEDLHAHCLAALVTETQVMVKREDEQAFAELNGAHLKFVEDAARLLHARLDADRRIRDFEAVCAHFESLHSHDAVSVICKGVPGGLRGEFCEFRALLC